MEEQLERTAIKAAINGNWAEAIKCNEELLDVGVGSMDTYNRLGRAYAEMGKWSKAVVAFEKALKIDPLSSVAEKGLYNAKMSRKGGLGSTLMHKDVLLKDLSTSQIIQIKLRKLSPMHSYELRAGKKDFYLLYDTTSSKYVKRVGKSKLNLKLGMKPDIINAKVLDHSSGMLRMKLSSSLPVFKAEKQQVAPALDLNRKHVEEEKKEIARMLEEVREE